MHIEVYTQPGKERSDTIVRPLWEEGNSRNLKPCIVSLLAALQCLAISESLLLPSHSTKVKSASGEEGGVLGHPSRSQLRSSTLGSSGPGNKGTGLSSRMKYSRDNMNGRVRAREDPAGSSLHICNNGKDGAWYN